MSMALSASVSGTCSFDTTHKPIPASTISGLCAGSTETCSLRQAVRHAAFAVSACPTIRAHTTPGPSPAPFAGAVEFQAGAIQDDVHGLGMRAGMHVDGHRPAPARQGRVIRHRDLDTHQREQAAHEPLRLTQRQSIDRAQGQRGDNRGVRVAPLATRAFAPGRDPVRR